MAGVSQGPTPWWTLPDYNKVNPATNPLGTTSSLDILKSNAPEGYEYDPIKFAYVRTPTSAGQRVNEYTQAAIGNPSTSLAGLQAAAGLGTPGSSSIGAGGGVTAAGSGINPGSQVPGVGPIDMTAANSAEFARAKDIAGKIGRSSIEALRGELGATGQLGGGAEAQATRDVVENAAGQIGDVNREQAIQRAAQALDIAKTNQSAAITQRGQDIAAQEAAARLAQEQTALASQRSLELLRLALSQSQNAPSFLY